MRWRWRNIFFTQWFSNIFTSRLIFRSFNIGSPQVFWVWLQKLLIIIFLNTIQFTSFISSKILTLHWLFVNLSLILNNFCPYNHNKFRLIKYQLTVSIDINLLKSIRIKLFKAPFFLNKVDIEDWIFNIEYILIYLFLKFFLLEIIFFLE